MKRQGKWIYVHVIFESLLIFCWCRFLKIIKISPCLSKLGPTACQSWLLVLPRDAMHKRSLCRHAVSVCPSVTFVNSVKTNKDIFENKQKSRFWANIWLHRMLWTLRRPAAINTIVGRYLAIDRCLLELVLSTDGRPSSGVSQSRCKSVYGTESHAPANTTKRREHNLIYAAVNLTREYN